MPEYMPLYMPIYIYIYIYIYTIILVPFQPIKSSHLYYDINTRSPLFLLNVRFIHGSVLGQTIF